MVNKPYKHISGYMVDVFFGDSSDMYMIRDNSMHLIVTSPPYFKMKGHMAYKSYEEYLDKMYACLQEMYRVLLYGRFCCININDYTYDGELYPCYSDFLQMALKIGFKFMTVIIWNKPKGAATRPNPVLSNPYPMRYYPFPTHEFILILRKGVRIGKEYPMVNKINIEKYRSFMTTVWDVNPETHSKHPTPYPEDLVRPLIEFYSFKNDIVLDPFLGGGTTLKVARELGRYGVGFEINEEYEPIIKEYLNLDNAVLDQFGG